MINVQHPISDALRYNYLQYIEKFKSEHLRKFGTLSPEAIQQIEANAYNESRAAIIRCFTMDLSNDESKEDFFRNFTRTGNSRNNIISISDGEPEIFKQRLLEEFIDTKPITSKAALLRSAIETTILNHDMPQIFGAIKKCFDSNNYESFSARRPGQGNDVNWREALRREVAPTEIADIFLSTVISPQRENIQDRVNGAIEKFKKTVEEKYQKVRNISVNPRVVRMEIMRAIDEKWRISKHEDMSIGEDLTASTDVGNNPKREQEDSVLIMYHPQNPGFKMLVVSDGMGGAEKGEVASSIVVEEMAKWFSELPPEMFDKRNLHKLKEQYEQKIRRVDRQIPRDTNSYKPGATFCGAIVTEKETIISNVGDSRAYIFKKGIRGSQLEQITSDDNVAFERFERGIIEKEDVTFQSDSNKITQSMGGKNLAQPRTTIIPNSSYDCLMLMSDGVTDCLYDAQIKAITETTPRDKLAQKLVHYAKTITNLSLDGRWRTSPGKDNTTVAVYDRKAKRKKTEEHEK